MRRTVKENIALSMRIDKQISERLENFCEETCRTKTAAVEMILREYLDKYDKSKGKTKG